jgi:hypothetical protein
VRADRSGYEVTLIVKSRERGLFGFGQDFQDFLKTVLCFYDKNRDKVYSLMKILIYPDNPRSVVQPISAKAYLRLGIYHANFLTPFR